MNEKLEEASWDLYFLANRWKLGLTPNYAFRDEVKGIIDKYAANKATNLFFLGVTIGALLMTSISLILIN